MHRIAIALLSVTLFACPGPAPTPDAGNPDAGSPDAGHQPTGLLQLQGPLEIAPGVTPPADVRVGVLWFPGIDTSNLAKPVAAESGPSLGATLPNRWSFDLQALPPASARAAVVSKGGGTGQASYGVVVLFRDGDGDGRLTVSASGASSDVLLGSSAGAMPFDVDGPGRRTLLVWREGTLGTDEPGLKAGLNVVTIDEAFATPVVVPPERDVKLTLTADPRLALTFCDAAYAFEPTPETACGQPVFRTPRVSAFFLGFPEGGLVGTVQVTLGTRAVTNARVMINGTVVPADSESSYTLFEFFPVVLRVGTPNRVRVDVPGLEPVVLDALMPAAPEVQAPLVNASVSSGGRLAMKWTAVPGASEYSVSLSADTGEATFESTKLTEFSLEAPVATGPATARVSVLSETALGRHRTVGTSETAIPVTLVPAGP